MERPQQKKFQLTPIFYSIISPQERKLIECASQGDVEGVKQALAHHASCDAYDSKELMAIDYAAFHNHITIVRLLLDLNAEPSHEALALAAYAGHEAIVQLLIERKAPINEKVTHFGTSLHAAIEGGNPRIVELLLTNGADANTEGSFLKDPLRSLTKPLHAAADHRGNPEIIGLLLRHGARIHEKNWGGLSALYIAASWGHSGAIKTLLAAGASPHDDTRPPLYIAACWGHEDAVTLLLDAGAEINAITPRCGGETALYTASENGRTGVVQILLSRGATTKNTIPRDLQEKLSPP
jgi:ankyrin repeat protein